MSKDIVKLYTSILHSLNLHVDHSGMVSLNYGDQSFPAMIGNDRLVMPTAEVLAAGDWRARVAFHPISENVMRGESAVLKKLRTFIDVRLSQVIITLLHTFTELAADSGRHAKLSPKMQEVLSTMPDADEKSVETIDKIIEELQPGSKYKLLSVYLKRGGKLGLEKFSRVAIVSFPLRAEFENDQTLVHGVKCRKKDFLGFEKLLDYILPGCEELETYSHGSNSMYAPYFDALMNAYIKVAERLNTIVNLYAKILPDAQDLIIDVSWAPHIADISIYRDMIPVLAGNDGESVDGNTEAAAVEPPRPMVEEHKSTLFRSITSAALEAAANGGTTVTTGHVPAVSAPTTRPSASPSGAISWDEAQANLRRGLQQPYTATAPVPMAVMPQPGQYYQPPMPAPPQYQQQQPVMPIPAMDQYGRQAVDQYGRPVFLDPRTNQAIPPELLGMGIPGQGNMVMNAPNPNLPVWMQDPNAMNNMAVPMGPPRNSRTPSFGLQYSNPASHQIPGWGPMGQTPIYR